jgi:hypothetical protein
MSDDLNEEEEIEEDGPDTGVIDEEEDEEDEDELDPLKLRDSGFGIDDDDPEMV